MAQTQRITPKRSAEAFSPEIYGANRKNFLGKDKNFFV